MMDKSNSSTRNTTIVLLLLNILLVSIVCFSVLRKSKLLPYLKLAPKLFTLSSKNLKSVNEHTNILILGKGGAGHDAPDLTDTIILASVAIDKPSVVLFSLPRDIWVPEIRAKLNSAYYWSKVRKDDNLINSAVKEITGQDISYTIVIDFSLFRKLIDDLGGVDVVVENSFTDEKFPISGKENDLCSGDRLYRCRYETISFKEGEQHMDGETSLKFVRSRNATGDEGTDIAREARQQKVVLAIKNKLLSKEMITSPDRIVQLIDNTKSYIETDIDEDSLILLARKFMLARNNLSSFTIPQEFMINPPISKKYDFQYVFVPKNGNWLEVKNWIESKID